MDMFNFFFKTFGIQVKADGFASVFAKRPIVDLFDFEEKLFQKHNADEDSMSLSELIQKEYGEDVLKKTMWFSGIDDTKSA